MNIYPFQVRIVTISSKGQFTIPKAIRTRLGIQLGDTVSLWVENGSIHARPVKPIPKHSHIA
jgi:AbrB family looped-hinge helix DNA binding protein